MQKVHGIVLKVLSVVIIHTTRTINRDYVVNTLYFDVLKIR